MKCQFCSREADKIYYINKGGVRYQICVCEDCLEKMWRKAAASGQEAGFRRISGWWPGKEKTRGLGTRIFPDKADEDLCRERELAALTNRLDRAAKEEKYEEAARLRDDIAAIRKEVCAHEN